MPHFQHCGETPSKVCSLADKLHKRCHAHKYVLTLYLLYANWLHYLKLMDLTRLLNSLCPPPFLPELHVFMFCLRCFQVPCLCVAELSFKSISLLKITRKEGNFQDLRHKFRTRLFAPHSSAIMARRAGQIFNPMHRFFRCLFMQVHWILHCRSANPRTPLFIVS